MKPANRILRSPNWTVSDPLLCLDIVSVEITNRIGEKGQLCLVGVARDQSNKSPAFACKSFLGGLEALIAVPDVCFN